MGRGSSPLSVDEKSHNKTAWALTANFGEQFLHIVIFKWEGSTKHRVQNHTAAPDIDLRALVQAAPYDLRCSVIGAAAARFQEVSVLDLV